MINPDNKYWVKCPECKKNLFKVTSFSKYDNIYVWCKNCKKEIEIKEPKSQIVIVYR